MHRKTILTGLAGIALLGLGYAAGAADVPVAKAYMVAEINVTDPQGYAVYAQQAPAILARHGGRYLARGGRTESLEGAAPAPRIALVEFASLAAAQRFYRSADYQKVLPVRQGASTGRFFLVEGLPPAP